MLNNYDGQIDFMNILGSGLADLNPGTDVNKYVIQWNRKDVCIPVYRAESSRCQEGQTEGRARCDPKAQWECTESEHKAFQVKKKALTDTCLLHIYIMIY